MFPLKTWRKIIFGLYGYVNFTKDGYLYEMNFVVNVLGTYMMTELMLPLLEKAAADARVITVASGGIYATPLTKDLQYSSNKFDGAEQYFRNKRVQVEMTEKWANKYKERGVEFQVGLKHQDFQRVYRGYRNSIRFEGNFRTSDEGADTVLWLALQPKERLVSGSFYFDRAEALKHVKFASTKGSHSAIDSIVNKLQPLSSL